jgi:hypothetical protein
MSISAAHIGRTDDSSCPGPHIYVISVIHPITHCSITDALLTTLKVLLVV